MKRIIILVGFSICLFSCNNNPKPAENNNAKSADTLNGKDTADKKQQIAGTENATDSVKELKLVCVLKGEDKDYIPRTDVMLSINGKQTLVKSIAGEGSVIPKSEYSNYQIPANAVSACGAYYAGGGDYFYVVMNNGKPEVYAGWQDEPQGDGTEWKPGYNWEKMKLK